MGTLGASTKRGDGAPTVVAINVVNTRVSLPWRTIVVVYQSAIPGSLRLKREGRGQSAISVLWQ